MLIYLQGIKNAEIPQKTEEKEDTVSVTLCNESYNNLNVERGTSTPNLVSTGETVGSDKETNTLQGSSKEDIPEVFTPNENRVSTPITSETNFHESISNEKDVKDKKPTKEKKPGPPSVSCVIQFNTMWYNFAAPPQTPITRKIDYTR